MSSQEKIKELIDKREQAKLGGGPKRVESQHAKGKMSARERIEMLLMENKILAEKDGIIRNMKVNQGDKILQDDILFDIE